MYLKKSQRSTEKCANQKCNFLSDKAFPFYFHFDVSDGNFTLLVVGNFSWKKEIELSEVSSLSQANERSLAPKKNTIRPVAVIRAWCVGALA